MNTATLWTFGAGLIVAWSSFVGDAQPAGNRPEPDGGGREAPAEKGVAVVEVFTSEGCNSCPPADDLAAKIARESAKQGMSVFVLAMHVDYWDSLGWKDPFAKSAFSKRQRAYASALGKAGGDGGVYTPEMVVSGRTGFVGSNATRAKEEIEKAIGDPARVKIEPTIAARKVGEPVVVAGKITGGGAGDIACAAVVEDGLRVEVKSGENGGRTLRHERVVRAFERGTIKDGRTSMELALPPGVREGACRVVVFVQDEKTMGVGGAAEMALAGASPAEGKK